MNPCLVKFNCRDCGKPVFVAIDRIRLDLDPAEPGVIVLTETCHAGHAREQRLSVTDHGSLVRELLEAGVQTPDGGDIEDALTTLTDLAAWLDSPAFDTERASLRLTGEVA
jgi:hypothetical protein